MSGDILTRWMGLCSLLTDEQLEHLISLAEDCTDPLAIGSEQFDAVSKTFKNPLTRVETVSTSYSHEDAAYGRRKPG